MSGIHREAIHDGDHLDSWDPLDFSDILLSPLIEIDLMRIWSLSYTHIFDESRMKRVWHRLEYM